MEKTARKPSTDSNQERLRQNKANWNKEVSSFVNDLIHFKKMMNGWPSKFFKERSRITEPVPADPATIIGSLAGDFQDLVNKGNSVIQEQLNYSKTRRQRQPKQMNLPFSEPGKPPSPEAPKPEAPDLSKQLQLNLSASNHASDYYLISEASNPLTRFFTRLLNLSIGNSEGAHIKKYRMSLLNAAIQMVNDLKKLQEAVVGSGPQSIFVAGKLLDKTENNWVFLSSGFQAYQDTLPGGAKDVGGKINVPPSAKGTTSQTHQISGDKTISMADAIISDIQGFSNTFANISGMSDLKNLALKFSQSDGIEKQQFAAALLNAYQQVLTTLSAQKNIPTQKSFNDIARLESRKTSSAQDQLEAVAQGFLGKLQHQLSPFDKTSALRLHVYKHSNTNRVLLDKIMDSLSDGLNVEQLTPLLNEVGSNMLKIRTLMNGLASTIRGVGHQPQFMNMLEHGRLGDYGVDLSPKEKINLEKMLKQKQLRELTKKY